MDALNPIHVIERLYERSLDVLGSLRNSARAADGQVRQAPRFPITKVSELVGRTAAAIREAEKDGRLPTVERTVSGRRVGYTLAEINHMREVFGTRPWRTTEDPLAVIAVQNFKGGVGKSTVSIHLAEYLAIQGYRVCLIDCDSQGSSTTLLGYVPDLDIAEEDTLYPFIRNAEMTSLAYAVRPTHWDGLYLIPANLRLYSAEYELAARIARAEATLLNRLSEGIASIADHFDVVILDPPPALGTISLSAMRAANALLVPIPPTVMDFTSTTAFLAMLHETMGVLQERGLPVDLRWLRVVATRADEQKSMQRELLNMMRNVFGDTMLRTVLKDSAEIDNASARLMSVYDLEQPVTSRETYQRGLTYLNGVNAEVETLIRLTWPSHAKRLREEGVL
ncbi:AAA family ATPase [Plastoroseomonas hellenica]|uniref:AAA family ATPase n=1 Tax=Plastoroseomonas hellenica TaxID=2687306 RepID=A0ABS5EVP7_9PROT|nr:AAA family ATPase [Plastoroseomonas hellenica]MBR0641355.1 AAA family ATPase [Plastoroseomonas hellenica]MBR0664354.1 AAA family ATPase [Plastoroseomonas hellenica]